jgi:phosphate starvation-inducible PhoH-like protein
MNKKNKNRKLINKELYEDLKFYNHQKKEYDYSNTNQNMQMQTQIQTQTSSYYHNYDYLSHNDKQKFDSKWTKPKNKAQEKYLKMLNKKQCKIVVSTGPAGTGKTMLATEQAIKNFLLGKCEKIIFTRPSVTVDEELGFLPGTLEEKMAPYIRPIYDILYNFIHPNEVKQLIENKLIEISPLGYMRGRTFKNAWIIADEMQNCTIAQMKMLMTRIGENTKLIITGDLDQNDRIDELNGLEDFLNKFKGRRSDSIGSVEFETNDIEREEVVKEVLEIYGVESLPSSYKETNFLKQELNFQNLEQEFAHTYELNTTSNDTIKIIKVSSFNCMLKKDGTSNIYEIEDENENDDEDFEEVNELRNLNNFEECDKLEEFDELFSMDV